LVTRVKICGLTCQEDAELAIELGASAIGFVLEPSSKRFLHPVPAWIAKLPVYVARVAVFGAVPASFDLKSFDAVQGLGVRAVYFAGRKIATVRCGSGASPESLIKSAAGGDAILLDAAVEGSFGGTGTQADWDVAAEVVRIASKPVILAGGLNPDNVADAIRKIRPFAVDVASGVEASPGVKDKAKMKAFFEAVRSVP